MAKASSFGGPVAVMAGILFSSKVALLPGICLGHCAWPMKVQSCPAGSLFALEVLHRTGMQFYEVGSCS